MKKTCFACGKPFNGSRASKFCSYECKYNNYSKSNGKAHYTRPIEWTYHGVCKRCGAEFDYPRKREYCSDLCSKLWQLEKAKRKRLDEKQTKYCKQCGTILASNLKTYCSKKCEYQHEYKHKTKKTNPRKRITNVVYTCTYCGKEYNPKSKERNKYCSRECCFADKARYKEQAHKNAQMQHTHICVICGKEFTWRLGKKYCSDLCRAESARKKSKEHERLMYRQKELQCKQCGKTFITTYGNKHNKYCSDTCSKKHASKTRKQTRRAKLHDAFVCRVDYLDIFERDKGKCQLCGKKIDIKAKAPMPRSGTLDHIVPLACGGTHEPKNVQLAHFVCNTRKGIKPMNEQTRLI